MTREWHICRLGYTVYTLGTRYEHCMNTQVEHILASTGVGGTVHTTRYEHCMNTHNK